MREVIAVAAAAAVSESFLSPIQFFIGICDRQWRQNKLYSGCICAYYLTRILTLSELFFLCRNSCFIFFFLFLINKAGRAMRRCRLFCYRTNFKRKWKKKRYIFILFVSLWFWCNFKAYQTYTSIATTNMIFIGCNQFG